MTYSDSYDSPFDFIAIDYDRIFTGSHTGKAQRDAVWRETDRLFQAGQCILEMNCGTGIDAVHFAKLGLSVFGFDQSGRMIDVAQNRLRQTGFDRQVHLHQMTIEDMGQWATHLQFDGVFSNFGGLNCVADLSRFSEDLSRLVKPGSRVILCFMNRYCLWEWAHFIVQFDFRKAFRRFHKGGISAQIENRAAVRVYYPRIRELVRWMQPHFRYVCHKAVGLTVPPTYLEKWVEQHPMFLRISQSLDNIISTWPILNSLGDHCLVHFIRR